MNRGVQVLRGEIRERGDQVRLAKRLQRDEGELSRVLRGLAPSLSFRQAAFRELGIEMHWWEEPEVDGQQSPPPMPDDDEPTAPELPALLEKRRSSAPPPMLDAEDEETTRRDHAPLPPVSRTRREREATDPDPRAGDELVPTPKPLTVLDRVSTPSPDVDA